MTAPPTPTRSWLASPFWLSLASGALVWAAMPPLSAWLLAWIAPVFWLLIIARKELPSRHPYGAIWLSSLLFWVMTLQGIRLAHWANYVGLVALAAYLGIYVPLFIAVARYAVHRWHIPLVLAAPIAWVGLELARGYGPLGFSMAMLAHTQVSQLAIIQVADLFGAYTISFLIMCVAAAIVMSWPTRQRRWRVWPGACALLLVALALAYGKWRLRAPETTANSPAVRVALIQGSIDTIFEDNPNRSVEMLEQYSRLTQDACERYGPFDLVVWPESMFPLTEFLFEPGVEPQLDPALDLAEIEDRAAVFAQLVRNGVNRLNVRSARDVRGSGTSWLLGTSTWQFGDYPTRHYNAALLAQPDGRIVARYYKMHPVMFGEYVPFGELFPVLYGLFPMDHGLTPGTDPVAISVGGLRFAPSICFESTMPHLIRRQVAELVRRGTPPDVLVNLTNDGWFWGSSILDLHLDCAVLRAVELRRPFLIAANTGFSAWIDGHGQVLSRGPRRAPGILVAEVSADGRASGYLRWGDMPAGLCAAACLAVALAAGVTHVGRRRIARVAE